MPTFRVTGHVNVCFIHEFEAPTAEKAEEMAGSTRLEDFDNYDTKVAENTIYDVIELDEDGEEIDE